MKVKYSPYIFLLFSIFTIAQEKNYSEAEVSISAPTVAINGTLLSPNTVSKNELVIIIPGSGPTDRDGNNSVMKNNSLKYLAEELIAHDIASYRFDKSVLSYSKEDLGKLDSLTFDDFIDEAKTVINYFKTSKLYSKIIVAGHSQGSLVGMIAAKNTADGFISLAGSGRTIDKNLIEQIDKQAPILKNESATILEQLKKGILVEEVNPMLNSLFRKSVQPFLISWIKYNPQIELKKLSIPILIIQGSKDIQVDIMDAELLHASNINSKLKIVENMNHLFKEIKGDIGENMSSYSNPNLLIINELTNSIVDFIKELK
jgi:alpha/beta superfamily hydrolase